jgi:PadR family transcriptional regulator PadR
MPRPPRLTAPTLRVLGEMLASPAEPVYGLELMDRCGIQSGTLYPILARLAEAGWLDAENEAVDPSVAGRPARVYYRLTAEGTAAARDAIASILPSAPLSWGAT